MANYTLKAIVLTFEEMLMELPFDKITVSAIVSKCGISSNTFYYINPLQWTADLLRQIFGLKNLKYTKYSCVFQTLP